MKFDSYLYLSHRYSHQKYNLNNKKIMKVKHLMRIISFLITISAYVFNWMDGSTEPNILFVMGVMSYLTTLCIIVDMVISNWEKKLF